MDVEDLRGKFRGCLLGALLGDCLGYVFEKPHRPPESKEKIDGVFHTYSKEEAPLLIYSDDTSMTRTLGWSLVRHGGVLDPKDVGVSWAKEFYRPQPNRFYGGAVRQVFAKLLKDSSDPFKAAQEQFDGAGSFGNGGAMRIAPVALLYHRDGVQLESVVRDATRITHTHPDAVHGAILQALAIVRALHTDPNKPITATEFISGLIEDIAKVECPRQEQPKKDFLTRFFQFLTVRNKPTTYVSLLQKADKLLRQGKSVDAETVISTLGNELLATESVVTAIYCFLRTATPDCGIQGETSVVRSIRLAIELGGDTDTIATMAAAISGACFGEKDVSANLLSHCEEADDVGHLADEIFRLDQEKASN